MKAEKSSTQSQSEAAYAELVADGQLLSKPSTHPTLPYQAESSLNLKDDSQHQTGPSLLLSDPNIPKRIFVSSSLPTIGPQHYDDNVTQSGQVNTVIRGQSEKSSPTIGSTEVNDVLASRRAKYGPYTVTARIIQGLEGVMRASPQYSFLSDVQKESLHMIANKIGRVLNGDINHRDSWIDIAGYATLVVEVMDGKQ